MKILFIGDNRTANNWGGRGGSIALYQMLEKEFDIGGVIYGNSFASGGAGIGYVNILTPNRFHWIFEHMVSGRERRKLFDWYVKFEELMGAKDSLSEDPVESADNIIRYRKGYPKFQEIYNKTEQADAVVINGEGDLVFATPPRREALFLLAMIEMGIRLGKKVFFVNAVVSDCPVTGRNQNVFEATRRMFRKCAGISLRDPVSYEFVKRHVPEAKCTYLPDSLFSWYTVYDKFGADLPRCGDFIIPHPEKTFYWGKLDFSIPYICIGGSSMSGRDPSKAVECYSKLVERIRELGYAVYLTENDGRDSFLEEVAQRCDVGIVPVWTPSLMCGAILAKAKLFISGRYHPTIFASLGGTPCVFLGSAAHKMTSLQKVLEYDDIREFSAFPNEEEIEEICVRSEELLNRGERFRERIKAVAKRRCEEAWQIIAFIKGNV